MLSRSVVVGPDATIVAKIVMNAVAYMVSLLPPEAVRRLAAIRRPGPGAPAAGDAADGFRRVLDVEEASAAVNDRWGGDLCGLLNALSRGELAVLSNRLEVAPVSGPRSPALRERLWQRGAALERADADVSSSVQPRPILLGGHLVVQAPPRGAYPPSARGHCALEIGRAHV